MLKQAYEHGHDDINQRMLISAIQKAEQLIDQLKNALSVDSHLLDETYVNDLKDCIQDVDRALATQERESIQKACDQLASIAQPFAEKRIANAIRQKLQHQTIS